MARQEANKVFALTSLLYGANAAYIEDLYAQYKENPNSVEAEWQDFFASFQDTKEDVLKEARGAPWKRKDWPIAASGDLVNAFDGDWAPIEKELGDKLKKKAEAKGAPATEAEVHQATRDSVRALMMIRAYRMRGHLHANLDPLGLAALKDHEELHPASYGFTEADWDRKIFIDHVLGLEYATIREMLDILKRTYCSTLGVEFMHISDPAAKSWLQERIEGPDKQVAFTKEGKKAILNKLIESEGFEKFLDVKYTGTKRFGLDGGEALIPALEQIIKRGGQLGLKEIVFGMAHRGRLNVLSQVMGKPHRAIFHEFKGGSYAPDEVEGSGDVKYHLGASSDRTFDDNDVHLSLTANPSHLEIVNPVVLGKSRAKQDQLSAVDGHWVETTEVDRSKVLPLLLHGDAAFAGQGVVSECFALSGLAGYRTGGTIHFIVNNQIGFTTSPKYSRSSPYPTDVALQVQAPIFHVNGDDPESVVHAAKVATEYRQKFGKDVVIDMFCYRRFGHNEGDEPMFTQPLMYKKIKDHPSVRELYSSRLVSEGVLSQDEVDAMIQELDDFFDAEFEKAKTYKPDHADWLDGAWQGLGLPEDDERRGQTAVEMERLKALGERLTAIPNSVDVHRTVKKVYDQRAAAIATGRGIDWATAEMLAFGSLVSEGFPVRLSGQDSCRGTFSQRHSHIIDQTTEQRYTPLRQLRHGQADYEVIDSLLSEEAVLGYEYGYSLTAPNTLTLWEAQFGDFANGAQVVFDQFLSAGERKWLRMSGLVCLLPHGYEGQGPEHSSARLERFLAMCAEDNIQVCQPSTPAQMFHLLRRQVLRPWRKPLVVMTPKSLLRHPQVISTLEDLEHGTFERVLVDDPSETPLDVKRVLMCSGRIFYDLLERRDKLERNDVAILRLEQFYPFPTRRMEEVLSAFNPKVELVWVQDEPGNMGAWPFLKSLSYHMKFAGPRMRAVTRKVSSSPATGSRAAHLMELEELMRQAFEGL